MKRPPHPKGRGARSNEASRFRAVTLDEINDDIPIDELGPSSKTQFFTDHSKTIVTTNDSPDIGFRYSLNAYRGCEHGCAYCYARPTHEYLDLSAGLDFETKIFVKERAPELLREKLLSKSWQPEPIFMSGVTDCYQPAERKFELTRRCLQVLAEFRNPGGIITKNFLVTRDIDILSELAADGLSMVFVSVTTLDSKLARELEPRTSSPAARLKAIEILSKAGIPTGVNIAPVIPGLTSHEMPAILKAASEAGARHAGYTPLRLPYSVKDIFSDWLAEHRPDAKEKVLNAIRSIRGGKLNDPDFGNRMRGTGEDASNLKKFFAIFARKYGFNQKSLELSTTHFRRPGEQLNLL